MNESDSLNKLIVLEKDGNQFLSKVENIGQTSDVNIWLAGVNDVLKSVLIKDSSLLEMLPIKPINNRNLSDEVEVEVEVDRKQEMNYPNARRWGFEFPPRFC